MNKRTHTPTKAGRTAAWLVLLATALLASSCGSTTTVAEPDEVTETESTTDPTDTRPRPVVEENSELDQFVRDVTVWDDIAPKPDQPLGRTALSEPVALDPEVVDVPTDDAEEEGTEQQAYECTTQTYSLTANPREVVLADPAAGLIWPGAIVDGAAHAQGSIRPIVVDQTNRAPLGISVAGGGVLGIRGGVSSVVDEPAGSTVREGVNQLIANAIDADVVTGAGYSSFDSVESHSAEQAVLELGLSGRYLGHRASAELDYRRNAAESTYTAYFIQRLYTIAIDPPEVPSHFFAPDVTPDDLTNLGVGPANPPLYVGSVSYGRILMYSITSTDSAEQISAAINYSYDGVAAEVDANAAASYQQTLSNSRIEVMAVGGPNTGVQNLIRNADLSSYFEAELALNQVEPIAFTLNRLSDNQIAEVIDATEYENKTCELVGAPLAQPIHWWTFDNTLEDSAGTVPLGGVPEQYGAGRFGSGMSFENQSANTFGEIPENQDQVIPTNGPYTVSAWVNPTSDTLGAILSQVGGRNAAGDMSIRVGNGRLFHFRRPSSGPNVENSSTWAPGTSSNGTEWEGIPNNQWTHIAVVYGAESDTNIQLYINGVDRTGSRAPSTYTGVRGDTMTRVGSNELASSGSSVSNTHTFYGSIDELMVFDQALDSTEVAVMFQNFDSYKN